MTVDELLEAVAKHNEEVRKDTAKVILKDAENELYNIAIEYRNAGHMSYFAVCENIYHKVIRPLAKQYGVEL